MASTICIDTVLTWRIVIEIKESVFVLNDVVRILVVDADVVDTTDIVNVVNVIVDADVKLRREVGNARRRLNSLRRPSGLKM
jgi:hypothetical protein